MKTGIITYEPAYAINRIICEEKKMEMFRLRSLLDICQQDVFPEVYSKKIKLFLLEYYGKKEKNLEGNDEYQEVNRLYNMLSSDNDKDVTKAKRRFLASVIEGVAIKHNADVKSEAVKKWISEKFEMYKNCEKISLNALKKHLAYDFEQTFNN